MASEPSTREDTRIWVGRLAAGHEAEHARFVEWLKGPEAASIFLRRRLTEYRLSQHDGTLMVVFRAPHTGDPRIMIDFLRYPGLWPDYWEFMHGGAGQEADAEAAQTVPGEVSVHWRRPTQPS